MHDDNGNDNDDVLKQVSSDGDGGDVLNKLHQSSTQDLFCIKALHEIGDEKSGLEDKCGRSIREKMTKCLLAHLPD